MKLLSEKEINKKLKNLNGWYFSNGSVKKKFKTKGYPQTVGLVTSVAALCQQFDHHPDYILMKYSEVEISFSTHSTGGVTDKDMQIAEEIEKL